MFICYLTGHNDQPSVYTTGMRLLGVPGIFLFPITSREIWGPPSHSSCHFHLLAGVKNEWSLNYTLSVVIIAQFLIN
jgi:hypothetical protein